MKILTFSFDGNISEEVLARLHNIATKYVVASDQAKVHDFIKNTKFNDFDYVLGMGMYSGRDASKIRIETVYTNKFHNNQRDDDSVAVIPFLHESEQFKITKRIGNSYCNLVSYLFVSKHPKVPYTFLHIPKNYSVKDATTVIDAQLERLS